MLRYFLQRVLVSLPTLFGISLICFVLVQLTPGGPVEMAIAQARMSSVGGETSAGRTSSVTEEQREALIAYYGFDKPIHTRYFSWLYKLATFDLGESYQYSEPVSVLIKRTLPVSLSFGLTSFFLTYLICVPLGIGKAVRHNSRFDFITSGLVFFLYSIPSFAFGVLLIVLFGGGSFWNVFPIQGMVSDNFSELTLGAKVVDFVHHMFLPLTCYTIGSFATLTMLMKNSLLEQLAMDYIVTAKAKGLSKRAIVYKHALRNALLPLANGFGQWIGLFFTGSILIESIFGLQGIGKLSYEAIVNRDYPIVLANIMILSVVHIAGNLISDFLYVAIDPRIDFNA